MSAAHRHSLFSGKKILITGAGSGIGRATALRLAPYNPQLILADLNTDNVEQTAIQARVLGAGADMHTVDVSDWDDMQALANRVHKQYQALDILINNAGVGLGGDFLSTPIEDWQWILGINVMGVVHGCKLFAPAMVQQGYGHIVNLASVAGYYAAPDMTAYSASKHAIMGLSESLRAELAESGIGVSAICPGVINTSIIDNGRMNGATGLAQGKISEFYRKRNYGPEHVADAIIGAIANNRAVTPVSPEAWALYGAKRFTPGLLGWANSSSLLKRLRP